MLLSIPGSCNCANHWEGLKEKERERRKPQPHLKKVTASEIQWAFTERDVSQAYAGLYRSRRG